MGSKLGHGNLVRDPRVVWNAAVLGVNVRLACGCTRAHDFGQPSSSARVVEPTRGAWWWWSLVCEGA